MKNYTLDNIVRGALAEKGYTIHWYINFLTYAVNGLRELNFDTLRNVKSVRLPVNSYKAVTIPCDYVDYVRIGDESGQYINPFGEKTNSFNRLNNFDSLGNKVAYDASNIENSVLPINWDGYWYTNYINDKGEHTGRLFNARPSFRNSFVVLRERDEIQLDNGYTGDEIVLDYITDGTSTDASNAVHPYAINTIKAYIFWQHKEHNRRYGAQERELAKQEFYNQLRILRARINGLDEIGIRRSLALGYSATVKN